MFNGGLVFRTVASFFHSSRNKRSPQEGEMKKITYI